tara:strand:+ start:11865 stop:13502 length:1638 start_codon:yes stop_codon:yes gene_type:complete
MHLFSYIFAFILISISIIGYGYIFNKYTLKIDKINIGYLGLIGIFFLTFLAYLFNIFIPLSDKFNFFLHLLGVIFFSIFFIKNFSPNKNHFKFFGLFLIICLFFIFTAKTHDDFEYYHFAYIHLLNFENTQIGIGQFNNGFRVPSSIFYFSSLFYLPYLKHDIIHLGPIFFTLFINVIFLIKIIDYKDNKNLRFLVYLSLIGLIISNIFFYRLGEHGTDRSAQILVILLFIEVLYIVNLNKENYKFILPKIIIIITLIASLKAFYLIYIFVLIPILIYQKEKLLFIKNIFILKSTYFSIAFFFIVLLTYFVNSGCFIYPLGLSCFNVLWAIPINEVNDWNNYYQLWSKAGATPNFKVSNPEEYIKYFNWLPNWINIYFFNKVSDYLLSILFISIIFFFYFFSKYKIKVKKVKYRLIYIFLVFLFIEWFFYHPALRYGGFHLIALITFIPISLYLQNYDFDKKIFFKKLLIIFSIILLISVGRNINRVIKETDIYNYNVFANPSYNRNFQNFKIYGQIKEVINCKSNCSNNPIKSKKIFGRNIFYR